MSGDRLRPSTALKLCLIFGLLFAMATNNSFADDKEATAEQLQQLNAKIAQLKSLLQSFKAQRSGLQNSLRKSELEIGKIQRKISTLKIKLKKENDALKSLTVKRAQLNSDKKNQRKFIEQQILSAYQIGQQKKLKVLLNQEDPDKLSRALTYYDYFNRARTEQIEDYINLITEIDNIEPAIIEKTQSLKLAKLALTEEKNRLLSNKEEREINLAKINATIKNKDQNLKAMSKDRAELERLLEAVEQTLANLKIPSNYKPFKQLKGKLPWPVAGKPSNRFGRRRQGSQLRWQGLTIPAKEGSEIQAIHHGRVVFADWFRGSGLLVIIDHGDGYMTLYAHNQSLLIETGDWVGSGEVIATVGNSGGQKRAGLYFEIRHNGEPTDPKRWCKRA
jgi:septal ring factor EnvC (AmiA/AmiB activator)